jgi:hypothetical protein
VRKPDGTRPKRGCKKCITIIIIIIKELGMGAWNGLIWLRVWTSDRLF